MKPVLKSNSTSLTSDDYATGVHYLPEVRLHEQVAAIQAKNGRPMCREEVNALADFIYVTMPATGRETKSVCPVCRDYLADCMLRGIDPFAPDQDVIDMLAKYGVRFSRWKHRKGTSESQR